MAYYLDEEAKKVHEEQTHSVKDDPEEGLFGESKLCSWTHVFDSLIRRFFTEDVLQDAYNYSTRSQKEEGEDEAKFALRLSKASRRFRHVFWKGDVLNYSICGLKPAVRELVAHHVRMMPVTDRKNLNSVNQAAIAV